MSRSGNTSSTMNVIGNFAGRIKLDGPISLKIQTSGCNIGCQEYSGCRVSVYFFLSKCFQDGTSFKMWNVAMKLVNCAGISKDAFRLHIVIIISISIVSLLVGKNGFHFGKESMIIIDAGTSTHKYYCSLVLCDAIDQKSKKSCQSKFGTNVNVILYQMLW